MISNGCYDQYDKRLIRHRIIRSAVDSLTIYREKATCVSRNYVRDISDYYTQNKDFSKNKEEAEKIEKAYITNWENLHDVYTGKKNVKDLVVCYLCGPDPNNDFQEFIDLGILPQNIWAFESNTSTYNQAVGGYSGGEFPQPRILKQNIETFFKFTPKKFDIVYIDACGSVPSAQHALRTITSLCLYSRLNSPGVIITNFSSPDDENEQDQLQEWTKLIAKYLYFKKYPEEQIQVVDFEIKNRNYEIIEKEIHENFKLFYGEFISSLLRDIPSVIVPIQRIFENPYFNHFMEDKDSSLYGKLIELARGNSLARYFFYITQLKDHNKATQMMNVLLGELGDLKKIIYGFEWMVNLRTGNNLMREDIKDIYQYFEDSKNIYQFLDKPHSNLIFDAVINQLIYPMHFNPDVNERYLYKAKTREMFTDISVYDECRYIYEWLPAMHQLKSAFENLSWQYVFRFALDGLIKTRTSYNNEFFYQGAVVQHEDGTFAKGRVPDRIYIDDM